LDGNKKFRNIFQKKSQTISHETPVKSASKYHLYMSTQRPPIPPQPRRKPAPGKPAVFLDGRMPHGQTERTARPERAIREG
jgi:hypothetical protein